jgi:type 1 glutamine amidotransferase
MRRNFFFPALLAFLLIGFSFYPMVAPLAQLKPKHIVIVTGDHEYKSEISMPMLAKILEEKHGFKCTVLYSGEPGGKHDPQFEYNISGLEMLQEADLAIFFLRWRKLPREQLALILDYVNFGKPVMGFRTSTHSFNYEGGEMARWNDGFGAKVFGQKWITHNGHSTSTNVQVVKEAADHAILKGVEPAFWVNSWLYNVTPLVGDCKPLITGYSVKGMNPDDPEFEGEKGRQPVAWTKTFSGSSGDKARIFFTTLGHPWDFKHEPVRKMAINAVYWCLGMENKIPAGGAKVAIAGAYNPPKPE